MRGAARRSPAVLGAVHLSDSNRHQPGTGPRAVRGRSLATLRDVGFDGVALGRVPAARRAREAVREPAARHLRALLDGWPSG